MDFLFGEILHLDRPREQDFDRWTCLSAGGGEMGH